MTKGMRADHVGSFLRPKDLLEARATARPEALRAIEDAHVLRVLRKQQELGFRVFTDGELRRRNFMSDFTDAVEGFDLGDAIARRVAPPASRVRPQRGELRLELACRPDVVGIDERVFLSFQM